MSKTAANHRANFRQKGNVALGFSTISVYLTPRLFLTATKPVLPARHVSAAEFTRGI